MPRFEQAVLTALGTLPKDYWQRIDGLMTEHVVMQLPKRAIAFRRLRLWLLEKRGLIESRRTAHFWRSQRGLKSYRLSRPISEIVK